MSIWLAGVIKGFGFSDESGYRAGFEKTGLVEPNSNPAFRGIARVLRPDPAEECHRP
jgi:hypothetical protein